MFGTNSENPQTRPWHAQAGDLLGDNYTVPGIVLCALGVVTLACTLTAAGYGFTELTQIGAMATAGLWFIGIVVLMVARRREEVIERKYGRIGHAPRHVAQVRYGAVRTQVDQPHHRCGELL